MTGRELRDYLTQAKPGSADLAKFGEFLRELRRDRDWDTVNKMVRAADPALTPADDEFEAKRKAIGSHESGRARPQDEYLELYCRLFDKDSDALAAAFQSFL